MAITLRASEQGLQVVDLARKKKGWAKTEEAWFQLALTSKATLKRFWERKPVQQETFIALCQAVEIGDWGSIVDEDLTASTSSRSLAFSAYNKETWVGREETLSTLGNQLQANIRLLLISGFTGIGKTALAERLAEDTIQAGRLRFEFHRISFDNEGQSQDFTTGAAAILAELGEIDLDPQERNDPQRLSDRLLQKLQNKPCWIQLDALERLLPKESAEFVDSHWLSFFQRCLNSSNFPSRLVLTTQTSPVGFEEFVDRYPTLWHEETLQGLSDSERLELFARDGIAVDEANRAMIDRIGQIYEGHPLVLQVIAREILARPFNGNVAQYWERYGNEFEQVARELQSQRVNPALYSRELQKRVRQRVEKSLKRLPTDALDLLCRASVYRRPVPETFWLALIDNRSPTQQQAAYRTLGDRALVEQEGIHQGQFLIRQHNLICDIAYNLLRQDSATWEAAERQAAHQWLMNYKSTPDMPNLEKVRGYLEAFYHFCELLDWERAINILSTQLNSKEFPVQLGFWGYYQEQIQLYTQLISISRKTDRLEGEGVALEYLGIVYCNLGNYPQAISCFQQHLNIGYAIGKPQWEEHALGHYLGLIHHSLGKYPQAIECHQQHLNIARKTNDRAGEGSALGNLGIAYYALGNYIQAINYHQHHLNIARELDNQDEEITALNNLGIAQLKLRQYGNALKNFQDALEIAPGIGNRAITAQVLNNLAELHQKTGSIDLAKQHCDRALQLAIELGIPLLEECRSLKVQLENER